MTTFRVKRPESPLSSLSSILAERLFPELVLGPGLNTRERRNPWLSTCRKGAEGHAKSVSWPFAGRVGAKSIKAAKVVILEVLLARA